MTATEFSDQFDVLYNNIMSNQAPGLDTYEKSVFLTKAQDEILKSYFSARLNKSAEGFDGNEKRQIDFSMVMKTTSYTSFTGTPKLDNKDNTKRIRIEPDIMMFINEFADVIREGTRRVRLVVVPLGYQELNKLSSKPYKRPTQYQAWRIIDNLSGNNEVEIIIGANDVLNKYTIRYIKRPYPIILEPLEGVTIEGRSIPYSSPVGSVKHACELDPALHEEILQRAIELAKAAYQGGLDSQLALGANSETNMGIVQQARN